MKPLVSLPSGVGRGPLTIALAAVALATLGVVVGRHAAEARASTATGDCAPPSSWPAAQPAGATAVLAAINAHRATLGLAPLRLLASLTASATWKARHMAAYNYMAHDDPAPPVARSFLDRVAACGYGGGAGENIARWYPSVSAVLQAWLAEPAHRANIEGGWSTTGIAVAVSRAGIPYWVEDFGTGDAAPPPPPAPPTTTRPPTTAPGPRCIVPRVTTLRQAVASNRLRRAGCGVRAVRLHTAGVAAGRVAWQSPRRGVRLSAGSPVTIAVSVPR